MLDTQPVTIFRHCFEYYYPHMPIGKVRIYQLLFFVCLFVYVCLYGYVRLRISPLMIKLAASTFARWFIRVLGRKSPSLGTLLPQKLPHKPKIGQIGCVARARQPWRGRRGRAHGPRAGSACVDIQSSPKTCSYVLREWRLQS